ncbi:metal ABC transporter permease [Candidatus Roizmanbacteria bacterium CG_4_10_14_0_8_um_filter_33_9]|uniref:Metal ABC transporter permease n=1 Tax=Candidatus Roizmanbacteria bacterium CG_4_10_14_0_8_um_filter_33_9 TaxID=1974826 RepID=A0A2M7QI89_9BACT|nr:MAG: metal ABC transporter permease [Candidatus Roizmanbacteria bacterium CG_4_10_14_0_8_um_filter_33_9]
MLIIFILPMQQLTELFQYEFMVRAFWAGLIVAIIAPLIGSFLVVRRLSLIADTLSHVALTGVAIGLLLGINPLITTMICTVVTAYIIEELRSNERISAESVLAMILPGGLAMALILISLANGFNTSLITYLFGSITAVTQQDLWIIFGLGIGIAVIFILFYREFMYTSFDEESARTSGIPVKLINHLFMILIALTVSVAMKVVGALLIGALMIIPVITAMQIVQGFKKSIVVSVGVAFISMIMGLIVSYYANLPAGATIVMTSISLFALISILKRI